MDYYSVLNINKNANLKQIRDSYKKLAKKWHPDKNSSKNAEKKFKKISEAYQILSDENKRIKYDNEQDILLNENYLFDDPINVFNLFFNKDNNINNLNNLFENLFMDSIDNFHNLNNLYKQNNYNYNSISNKIININGKIIKETKYYKDGKVYIIRENL